MTKMIGVTGVGGSRKSWLIVGGIFTAIVLFAVCFGAIAPPSPAPPSKPPCQGVADRSRWMTARGSDGRSPYSEGFKALGDCSEKLVHREFSCARADVLRIDTNDPWLREAHEHGFTTYVCEAPGDDRTDYPITMFVP